MEILFSAEVNTVVMLSAISEIGLVRALIGTDNDLGSSAEEEGLREVTDDTSIQCRRAFERTGLDGKFHANGKVDLSHDIAISGLVFLVACGRECSAEVIQLANIDLLGYW